MEIQPENGILAIKGLGELGAASLRTFREAVATAARLGLTAIDVDLSQVCSVDASSLGVLASLYRLVGGQSPTGIASVRLLNPQPGVLQMLELARMDLLYEIVLSRTKLVPPEPESPADLLEAA